MRLKTERNLVPGPGSYNTQTKLIQKSSSAAGIGLGKRAHQKQDLSKTLGPGAYNTSSRLVQKKGSAAGIGLGSRFDHYKKKADLPAPDKY